MRVVTCAQEAITFVHFLLFASFCRQKCELLPSNVGRVIFVNWIVFSQGQSIRIIPVWLIYHRLYRERRTAVISKVRPVLKCNERWHGRNLNTRVQTETRRVGDIGFSKIREIDCSHLRHKSWRLVQCAPRSREKVITIKVRPLKSTTLFNLNYRARANASTGVLEFSPHHICSVYMLR